MPATCCPVLESTVHPPFESSVPVGFWSATPACTDGLPWPQPDATPWPDRETFLAHLQAVEARFLPRQHLRFMGHSLCRLCGAENGCGEFVDASFHWPSGYLHYVRDHDVRPSVEFVAWVAIEAARAPSRPSKADARRARRR